jgi:hypothetical protein
MVFTQEIAGEDGWSDWIKPRIAKNGGYKVACCDCGLVHDMEMRRHKDGLQYRVRLNKTSTAAVRRERKKRGEHVP